MRRTQKIKRTEQPEQNGKVAVNPKLGLPTVKANGLHRLKDEDAD